MSKRSRTDFEGLSSAKADGSRQIKRVRKDENTKSSKSIKSPIPPSITATGPEFECPVCYEDFNGAIYQCQEGHLLCDKCRPNLDNCPTCRVPFDGMIRNRMLEHIIRQNNNNNQQQQKHQKQQKSNVNDTKYPCCLCSKVFKSNISLNKHYNICDYRCIQCPFVECEWKDSFKKWSKHAKDDHHTCIGSVQSVSNNENDNDQNKKNRNKNKKKDKNKKNQLKQYTFNHAIKFPKDTFSVK